MVIIYKSVYIQEGYGQLSDTHIGKKVRDDPISDFMHRIILHVHNMVKKGTNHWKHWSMFDHRHWQNSIHVK